LRSSCSIETISLLWAVTIALAIVRT
jgi:hypothetical protein